MTKTIATDVAVIGAGLGGLSAAGHLQAKGYDVVVLEHHTKPGGYAHNFKERGYRFEVALHALDGMEKGGWAYSMFDLLGVFDRVEMNRLDPFYTVAFPDFEVSVRTDVTEYVREFSAVFPDEREGVAALFSALQRLGHDMARYSADMRRGEGAPMDEMVQRYPEMSLAFSTPWAVYVAQYIESTPEAKLPCCRHCGVISALPPSSCVRRPVRPHTPQLPLCRGAWYPTGGSGAMTKSDGREHHRGAWRRESTTATR